MDRTPKRDAMEAVTREWIALWCAPIDWTRFDALHAESFEDGSPAGRSHTKRGFAEGLADLIRAFPDLRTDVLDLVVDEASSRVAVRWRAEGTNRARYLGVGPTNRHTVITGIEIVEIRDGRVARRWGEWDITEHREPATP